MNQSTVRQTQTHYAVVGLVGMDGSAQQGLFFGTCLVLDCDWMSPYTDDESLAESYCAAHNLVTGVLPTMVPGGAVDWYGGRSLQPWEYGYPAESQAGILYGPGNQV